MRWLSIFSLLLIVPGCAQPPTTGKSVQRLQAPPAMPAVVGNLRFQISEAGILAAAGPGGARTNSVTVSLPAQGNTASGELVVALRYGPNSPSNRLATQYWRLQVAGLVTGPWADFGAWTNRPAWIYRSTNASTFFRVMGVVM